MSKLLAGPFGKNSQLDFSIETRLPFRSEVLDAPTLTNAQRAALLNPNYRNYHQENWDPVLAEQAQSVMLATRSAARARTKMSQHRSPVIDMLNLLLVEPVMPSSILHRTFSTAYVILKQWTRNPLSRHSNSSRALPVPLGRRSPPPRQMLRLSTATETRMA